MICSQLGGIPASLVFHHIMTNKSVVGINRNTTIKDRFGLERQEESFKTFYSVGPSESPLCHSYHIISTITDYVSNVVAGCSLSCTPATLLPGK